ncbi:MULTISPECIES: thioredoxin family protein [unclassified Oceanobacillus]|uniref:thioredoxin family protein n=1 Tax=unclassified Oceanobacillus TaxID=2630292 RepID=UPI0012EBC4B3|nr:thioredoxin family protein [Oceanobacillus sp. AG]
MQKVISKQLKKDSYLLYIYSPFCGTCHIARTILEKIEDIHGEEIFYEMNANFEEAFLHEHKIENVPCLLIKENNEVKEKVYTFYSTGNIYRYLFEYKPELFAGESY